MKETKVPGNGALGLPSRIRTGTPELKVTQKTALLNTHGVPLCISRDKNSQVWVSKVAGPTATDFVYLGRRLHCGIKGEPNCGPG